MAGKIDKTCTQIVDTGVTEHMTRDYNLLEGDIYDDGEPPVIISNGDQILLKRKGNYILPNGVKIAKVLYIPMFNCTLLSVSRMTKDLNCYISFFFLDFFIVQDLQMRSLIGAGQCDKGLYRMGMSKWKAMKVIPNASIWHKRLGHASEAKLHQVEFLASFSFEQKNKV